MQNAVSEDCLDPSIVEEFDTLIIENAMFKLESWVERESDAAS
jgi:hypothetical protein